MMWSITSSWKTAAAPEALRPPVREVTRRPVRGRLPETPAPPQETPKAPVKKDTGKEPLTPSFSIPNPAMFYP